MPYAVIVSTPEAELIREIWGQEGSPAIKADGNMLWLDPKHGRAVTQAACEYQGGEDFDENVRRRLIERVASLCGKSLLEPVSNPIETEPETSHIEEDDAEAVEDIDADAETE